MPNGKLWKAARSVLVCAFAALPFLVTIACAHHVELPAPIRPVAATDIVLADSMDIRRVTGDGPRYPEEMQAQAIEARLIALSIVDTIGRVDLTTVRFDRNAPLPFRVAVCRSLAESRFTPLRRDGLLRPALVVSPYVFAMAGHFKGPRPATTNARLVREAIAQMGIPTALEQMASAPGCPS